MNLHCRLLHVRTATLCPMSCYQVKKHKAVVFGGPEKSDPGLSETVKSRQIFHHPKRGYLHCHHALIVESTRQSIVCLAKFSRKNSVTSTPTWSFPSCLHCSVQRTIIKESFIQCRVMSLCTN